MKTRLEKQGIVIISSPEATGKSSLLQLFRSEQHIEGALYLYTKFSRGGDAFKQLEEEIGFYYDGAWYLDEDVENEKIVLVLDDAQCQYGNAKLWDKLLKRGCPLLANKKVYIVIACTYLLSGGDSPVQFDTNNILRLRFDQLQLSHEESSALINSQSMGLHAPMQSFTSLKKLILNECDGHIGALRITIDRLNAIHRNTRLESEEQAIAQWFDIDLDYILLAMLELQHS
jgi:hypothetical protein